MSPPNPTGSVGTSLNIEARPGGQHQPAETVLQGQSTNHLSYAIQCLSRTVPRRIPGTVRHLGSGFESILKKRWIAQKRVVDQSAIVAASTAEEIDAVGNRLDGSMERDGDFETSPLALNEGHRRADIVSIYPVSGTQWLIVVANEKPRCESHWRDIIRNQLGEFRSRYRRHANIHALRNLRTKLAHIRKQQRAGIACTRFVRAAPANAGGDDRHDPGRIDSIGEAGIL